MSGIRASLPIFLAAALVLGAATALSDTPLTNKDVVSLSQLGIGDGAVIAKIRQAPAVSFRLDVDDLGALKKAGVSGPVIAAMLDRAAADAGAGAGAGGSALVKEPEYIGTFCWRDSATGEVTPLERQTGTVAMSVTAMGFGGGESYIRVTGDRSPIRFKEGSDIEFAVLAASQSADPQQLAELFAIDVVDGERRIPVMRVASMGLGARSAGDDNKIAINGTKYGKSSFLIKSAEPLGPGEYAFAGATTGVVFCFGVDGNPGSGRSRLERVLPIKQNEKLPLDITERGMTVHSIEVIRWPSKAGSASILGRVGDTVRRNGDDADARAEVVVLFRQSNRAGRDYKCSYDVYLLDDDGNELGSGQRTVGIEDGEIDDGARVGISIRLADLSKASKLRVRVVPQPDL